MKKIDHVQAAFDIMPHPEFRVEHALQAFRGNPALVHVASKRDKKTGKLRKLYSVSFFSDDKKHTFTVTRAFKLTKDAAQFVVTAGKANWRNKRELTKAEMESIRAIGCVLRYK